MFGSRRRRLRERSREAALAAKALCEVRIKQVALSQAKMLLDVAMKRPEIAGKDFGSRFEDIKRIVEKYEAWNRRSGDGGEVFRLREDLGDYTHIAEKYNEIAEELAAVIKPANELRRDLCRFLFGDEKSEREGGQPL